MSEFEKEGRPSKRPERDLGKSAEPDRGESAGDGKKRRRGKRGRRKSAPGTTVDNRSNDAPDSGHPLPRPAAANHPKGDHLASHPEGIARAQSASALPAIDQQTSQPSTGEVRTGAPHSHQPRRAGKRARRRNRRKNTPPANAGDGAARETKIADSKTPINRNRRRLRRTDRKPNSAAFVKTSKQLGPQNGDQNRQSRHHGKPERQQSRARPRDSGANHTAPYAALDLGTNNCRLLMAVPQAPGRFRVVDAFSRIVRLGEGMGASGKLSDAAMERTMGALRACAAKLAARDVKRMRLIATEACRRATNGDEFLQRVKVETGLDLEIVDRETEARLAVAGCSALVDRRASGAVLFDIGGGSSELALLDLRKRRKHDLDPAIASWTSLPLGVVTLSEKHGGGRTVTRKVFESMVDDVTERLSSYEGRNALVDAMRHGEVHLLGTSGTVTTLAGIHLKLPRYDRRQVDGTWMVCDEVSAIVDELVDMTYDDRVLNPCIGKERADLVLAGCAILVAILRLWPCPRLRVADRGLREGLLTRMMNEDDSWQRRPNDSRHRRR